MIFHFRNFESTTGWINVPLLKCCFCGCTQIRMHFHIALEQMTHCRSWQSVITTSIMRQNSRQSILRHPVQNCNINEMNLILYYIHNRYKSTINNFARWWRVTMDFDWTDNLDLFELQLGAMFVYISKDCFTIYLVHLVEWLVISLVTVFQLFEDNVLPSTHVLDQI